METTTFVFFIGKQTGEATKKGRREILPEELTGIDLGTAGAVRRRLLLTAEGKALRRLAHEVDIFEVGWEMDGWWFLSFFFFQ